MKLGAQGFIAFDPNLKGIMSQSFPALSSNPVDVSGAGDCLLSIMAVGLASSENMMIAAAVSACGAALAVDSIGNNPVTKTSLKNKVIQIFKE